MLRFFLSALADEAFVRAHHQLSLELLQRVDGNADHNENRGGTKVCVASCEF